MSDFFIVCLSYLLGTSLLGSSLVLFVQLGQRFGLDDWLAASFGLVCVGCVGYLSFFVYWLSVPAGTATSLACLAILILFGSYSLWMRRVPPRELLQAMGFAALFGFTYLSLLFWYVPEYSADTPSGIYFELPRPHDQKIPLMFAEAIYDRLTSRVGRDVWGWYFSDRPPLQTGFVLLFSPMWTLVDRAAAYQAIATTLQTSCLVAAWLLCRTLGFRHRETLLAVVVTGASGFVYFNSIYAWPKLLAATFVLVAVAPLARAFLARERIGALPTAIAMGAAALAILAHGGAIYSLVPLTIVLSLRLARLFDLRAIAIGAAVFIALYGPWVAYGGYVDPNTSRLLKAHLTNGDINSPEPFTRMLLRSYQNVPIDRWLSERITNVKAQFRHSYIDHLIVRIGRGVRDERLRAPIGPPVWPVLAPQHLRFDLVSLGAILRTDQREIVFRSLGFLNIAWPLLILLILRRRNCQHGLDPPLIFLLALNVLTSVWWCIAQFNGGSTVITHSSFAMVLIAFLSAAIILRRVSHYWARVIYIANIMLSFIIWALLAPGPFWSQPRNNAAVVATAAGAAGILALAYLWFRSAESVVGAASKAAPQPS